MDISKLNPLNNNKKKKEKSFFSNNKELRKIISEEVELISNRQSLITITNLIYSKDGKNLDILFTVLPQKQSHAALTFLNRNKNDIRKSCQKKLRGRNLPFFSFRIDEGELNRQHIDTLLRN